jgi:hypothetical protein
MEVVRATRRIRLAEPVHLLGAIRRVAVADASEPLEARAGALEVGHPDKDVDDRLRGEPGHGGAANVVNVAGVPLVDRAG